MEKTIKLIRELLLAQANEKVIKRRTVTFKENVNSIGVNVPKAILIGKEIFKSLNNLSKNEVFALSEMLLKTGIIEESFIAFYFVEQFAKEFACEDFNLFERWINEYISNWASCDTFCNHTIGTFLEMYPNYINKLLNWTKSSNRWVRRAAAVSLIIPARKGLFKKEIFQIADNLLLDDDDLVQKGYGWMLKSLSKASLEEVYNYVVEKKEIMPRTAFRYAIEKMPNELKVTAMKKTM